MNETEKEERSIQGSSVLESEFSDKVPSPKKSNKPKSKIKKSKDRHKPG